MSDQNEMRAALESLLKRYGDLAGSGDAGNWDWEAEDVVTAARSALAATPAPQAAPSDVPPMTTDEAREYLIAFMKRHFTDKTFHRYILADRSSNGLAGDFAWQLARALHQLAAAPAVAITQAATSEPVATVYEECGEKRISERYAALQELAAGTELYAGAAPVAHLAGTTPNTEAPSDERAAFFAWFADHGAQFGNVKDAQDAFCAGHRAALSAQQAGVKARKLVRWTFDAGMTASVRDDGQWVLYSDLQQAGVQEAPSEDAKEFHPIEKGYERQWMKCRECGCVQHYDYVPYSLSTPVMLTSCGHGVGQRDLGCDYITEEEARAALAAATQTEKP